MNLRRIYILLVAWCACVLLPGLLVAVGLFGNLGPHMRNLGGSVVAVWIAGYLAQLAIFMWVMRLLGEQKILAWLLMCMLPWGVDWTLPVSLSYLLLWCPVTFAIAGWIAYGAQQTETLIENGIPARGVVLEVVEPLMNMVINNVYIRRKLRLRIEREDHVPAYEAFYKGLFMIGNVPSPGDSLPLLVDPAKPQRLKYDKAGRKTHAATAPTAVFSGTSSTTRSTPATAFQSGRSTVVDELSKLAELHKRGDLSDAEYDAAKKKVLRH